MRRFAVLAIALLVIAARVEAKGPTVKLTLTGPGLARAIEITDAGLLDGSNVWGGAFIGDTMAAAPTVKTPRYTVAFDVQAARVAARRRQDDVYGVGGARRAHRRAVAVSARPRRAWLRAERGHDAARHAGRPLAPSACGLGQRAREVLALKAHNSHASHRPADSLRRLCGPCSPGVRRDGGWGRHRRTIDEGGEPWRLDSRRRSSSHC